VNTAGGRPSGRPLSFSLRRGALQRAPNEAAAVLLRAASDKSPHQQDERCAHDASDEASSLTSLIPTEGLSEVGRDEGTGNAKGCS